MTDKPEKTTVTKRMTLDETTGVGKYSVEVEVDGEPLSWTDKRFQEAAWGKQDTDD